MNYDITTVMSDIFIVKNKLRGHRTLLFLFSNSIGITPVKWHPGILPVISIWKYLRKANTVKLLCYEHPELWISWDMDFLSYELILFLELVANDVILGYFPATVLVNFCVYFLLYWINFISKTRGITLENYHPVLWTDSQLWILRLGVSLYYDIRLLMR